MILSSRNKRIIAFQKKIFLLAFCYMFLPLFILHCSNTEKDVPNSPVNLQATPVSSSEINLSWTDNSDNETGFRIESAPDDGGSPGAYEIIATTFANENSYNNTGLEAETTYHYRVYAFNNAGDSLPAEASAITQGIDTSQSLTQFGITWTFDKEYEYGQFANGDYWVVGPVTIVGIDPASGEYLGEIASEDLGKYPGGIRIMHGSMVNPSPTLGTRNGYDNYIGDYPNDYSFEYDPLLNVARPGGADLDVSNPLILQPDSSLVSVISRTLAELKAAPDPKANLKTAAILTVLAEPAPDGSFRPPYCGSDKSIKFNQNQLDFNRLDKLSSVEDTPRLRQDSGDQQADSVERMFERPWIDHVPDWPAGYFHPADNMPWYGREIAAQVGEGALMLHLDFSDAEKGTLLVRFIQLGIDLYGIVEDEGENNWVPTGGITMGRKWPILFAGVMLNDDEMKNVGQRSDVYFGEDGQTFYVSAESVTITNGEDWVPDDRGGPIEPYDEGDIGLPEWGIRHSTNPYVDNKHWTANYRRCCTANSWAGFVLAAHIMGLKDSWNHDALFDYQDRYMSIGEYDSYMRQWSDFTENMWDAYRADYGCVWTRTDPDDEYSQGDYDCGD